MSSRLEWVDISPYRAVLYEIRSDNPFNRKVAVIEYDFTNREFYGLIQDKKFLSVGFAEKKNAMEATLAALVFDRLTQENEM